MAESFKLPSSSYEELVKIIKAYAGEKQGEAVALDNIVQSTGIGKTTVSANNGFLVQIGLVSEGNKKVASEACIKLGRAYIHCVEEEAINIWRELIDNDEFLNRMISAIKIRNGMDKTSFINHILYSSGQKGDSRSKAGAGAIVEIFKFANLVNEVDGKLTVIQENVGAVSSNNKSDIGIENDYLTKTSVAIGKQQINTNSLNAQFIFNINIDCSFDKLDELPAKIKGLIEELSE